MPFSRGPRPLRTIASAILLLTFALTGPGLGGLELAAHLTGLVDLAHASQAHYEAAGQTAHADECDLGAVAADGRVPARRVACLVLRSERDEATPLVQPPAPGRRPLHQSYPRAPPA